MMAPSDANIIHHDTPPREADGAGGCPESFFMGSLCMRAVTGCVVWLWLDESLNPTINHLYSLLITTCPLLPHDLYHQTEELEVCEGEEGGLKSPTA